LKILVYWPSAPSDVLDLLVEGLSRYGEVLVARGLEEAIRLVVDVDVLVGFASNEIIEAGSKLRFVQLTTAGVDHLDLELVRRRGVMLASAKGINSFYVAELALALMLALVKRIPFFDRMAKKGVFPRYTWEYSMETLKGKKVVILGYGGIGRELARLLKPLGVYVVGVRREVKDRSDSYADEVVPVEEIERVLEGADFLVITAPLTRETKGLIGEHLLRKLKRGAYIVNVSRGPIVDESALDKLMKEGWIRGAGLDVWWLYPGEGVYSSLGVHENPDVIATPHRGGFVKEAFLDVARFAIENVGRFARGETPLNLVDLDKGY